jgi:hypothetical protein
MEYYITKPELIAQSSLLPELVEAHAKTLVIYVFENTSAVTDGIVKLLGSYISDYDPSRAKRVLANDYFDVFEHYRDSAVPMIGIDPSAKADTDADDMGQQTKRSRKETKPSAIVIHFNGVNFQAGSMPPLPYYRKQVSVICSPRVRCLTEYVLYSDSSSYQGYSGSS